MNRHLLLAVAAAALLALARAQAGPPDAAGLLGHQTQAPHQPTPSPGPGTDFKVEVNYVEVDASVTDEQGRSVAGLTANDFELFDAGRPQKIETFAYLDIPMPGRSIGLDPDRPIPTPVDVRSNREPASGRLYIFVLDDSNISLLRTADVKHEARQFIESYFGVGDVGAVAYTSGRADASQDFTSDPQLLLASIDKFIGRRARSAALDAADKYYEQQAMAAAMKSPSNNGNPTQDDTQNQNGNQNQDATQNTGSGQNRPQSPSGDHAMVDLHDFERSQRAISVLGTLKALSESVVPVRGRRKALVMFSEGIDYQMSNSLGMSGVTDVLRATEDAIRAAARANVNIYTIDPRGLVGMTSEFMQMRRGMPEETTQAALMEEMRTSQDSLRTFAEQTGGFAALNSNAFAPAFERIVENNSRYYVLGYYPEGSASDGQFHNIDVRVKRPGLKVSARRGYASPRDERRGEPARAGAAKRADPNSTSPELRAVLDSPIQKSGLSFSVQAAPFRNTDKEVSVALSIEVDGEHLQFSTSGPNGAGPSQLELSFFGINDRGEAGVGVRKELDLALKAETAERVKTHGIRLNPRMLLAPGRYQLRIGARETAAGQTGSVFYDLIVPDFGKQPLAMSGLLLTSASAQQTPTAEPDPLGPKVLPGAATSRREFPVGDTLAVYAEVYDNSSSRQSRQIDVLVRLTSEDDIEVFVAKDSMASGSTTPRGGQPERQNIYAEMALTDLQPGVYRLRVEAQLHGTDSTAARETVITVVP